MLGHISGIFVASCSDKPKLNQLWTRTPSPAIATDPPVQSVSRRSLKTFCLVDIRRSNLETCLGIAELTLRRPDEFRHINRTCRPCLSCATNSNLARILINVQISIFYAAHDSRPKYINFILISRQHSIKYIIKKLQPIYKHKLYNEFKQKQNQSMAYLVGIS